MHGVVAHFVLLPPPTPTGSGAPVSLRIGIGISGPTARRAGDANLAARAEAGAQDYKTATPYPHAVLDNLLPEAILQQALDVFPGPGAVEWDHYRDKDQVDVDVVITRGRKVWGVEVKAGSAVDGRDGRGLRRLADVAGRDFQGGAVLYGGASTLPTADRRVLAVPLRELWTQ